MVLYVIVVVVALLLLLLLLALAVEPVVVVCMLHPAVQQRSTPLCWRMWSAWRGNSAC